MSAVDLQSTFRKHEGSPAVFGTNAVIATTATRIRAAVALTGSTPDSEAPFAVLAAAAGGRQPLPPLLIMDQAGGMGKTRAQVDAVSTGTDQHGRAHAAVRRGRPEPLHAGRFPLSAEGRSCTCPERRDSTRAYTHSAMATGCISAFWPRNAATARSGSDCRGAESNPRGPPHGVCDARIIPYLRGGARFNATDAGKALLKSRWQVEPTIAWLVRYHGCRQARRVGQEVISPAAAANSRATSGGWK